MNDELLRLKATLLVQTADISALLGIIESLEKIVRPDFPELPDLKADFLKRRRELVQFLLEDYETTNPELAAKLQQIIDGSSKHFPFDYE